MSRALAIVTALLATYYAVGQAFNIDVNQQLGPGAGVPSDDFGAAANMPGRWNGVSGVIGGAIALVGLDGQSTSVSLSRSGAGSNSGANNANTSLADYEWLLDDLQSVGTGSTAWTISGLASGTYRVYTYAISPGSSTARTNVTISGSTQTVGGAMPLNAFAPLVTHSTHTVSSTGTITVTIANSTGGGSVNGMQIVPVLSRIYVRAAASGRNSGGSWTDACRSLQSAIATAAAQTSGADVWVAAGTYKPSDMNVTGSERYSSFRLRSGVEIYGGFAGTETALGQRNWTANATTLSGNIGGAGVSDNSHHVVSADQVDFTARLDGFTVRDGYAPVVIDFSEWFGAGIRLNSAGPTIQNCEIVSNSAGAGGGMDLLDSGPLILECRFRSNVATGVNGTSGFPGGALRIRGSSNPIVRNCVFSQNSATGEGGAIAIKDDSVALIAGCLFTQNSASGFANSYGGAIGLDGSGTITIWNCTAIGNATSRSDGAGGFDLSGGAEVTMLNNVLWDNTSAGATSLLGQVYHGGVTLTANNNVTRGGVLPGTANEGGNPPSYDPGLTDANGHLSPGSRLVDSGSDFINTFFLPNDLEGNPRQLDIPSRPLSGTAALTDRGAYEYTRRRYVRASAPAGGAGATWATAYAKLQDALTFAQSDADGTINEIFVAAGTYLPDETSASPSGTNSRTATFALRNSLAVLGGFVGSETSAAQANPTANATILSGAIGGSSSADNSYHVVTSTSNDATAVFDGFQIVGGNADGTGSNAQGGGIRLSNSSPQVRRCVIDGNSANDLGGGVYALGGVGTGSGPAFSNCTIQDNVAGAGGAGVYFVTGLTRTLSLVDCMLYANLTTGATAVGAGLYADLNVSAGLYLTRCTVDGNLGASGAGLRIKGDGGVATLIDCAVKNCTTTATTDNGGAASIENVSNLTLATLTFDDNEAPSLPPTFPPLPSNGEILSCTTTTQSGGIILVNGVLDIGPTVFYADAGSIAGPGGVHVGLGGTLRATESRHPGLRLNTNIVGRGAADVGDVELTYRGTVWLGSGATIDLSGADVAASQRTPRGTLLVNKQLRAGNDSENPALPGMQPIGTIQNCNVDIGNDQTCGLEAGGFIALVTPDSRVRWNTIDATGDRYLRYLFSETPGSSANLGNLVRMAIWGNLDAFEYEETLESRQTRLDSPVGLVRLASSSGYSQPWAIDTLTLAPYARVNVIDIVDDVAGQSSDVAYVKHIRLGRDSVFNGGVGTVFFQTMEVEDPNNSAGWIAVGGPPFPNPLPGVNPPEIIGVPLMGYSLGIIQMENDCEFQVRVARSAADLTRVTRVPVVGSHECAAIWESDNRGYMEMRTSNAASSAAKGTFSRAEGERVVVQFKYLFRDDRGDAYLDVYLSEDQAVGLGNVHLATIFAPAPGRPGAENTCEWGVFHARVPVPAGMTFAEGTYVELVLRNPGSDSPGAIVWIDEFDPLVDCSSGVCFDFNGLGNVDSIDYLIALSAYGEDLDPFGPVVRLCLDHQHGDTYVDNIDLYSHESYINAASTQNPCALNLPAPGLSTNTTPPAGARLLIAGRPTQSGISQPDKLYPTDLNGAPVGPGPLTPPAWIGPRGRGRGNGRLIHDPFGQLYQLNATQGLVRLRDGEVILPPSVLTSPDFPGMTIYVGPHEISSTESIGRPILDAAFDPHLSPGQLDADVLYVAPVLVQLADGFTYSPAAKLQLTFGPAGNVVNVEPLALYGADPRGTTTIEHDLSAAGDGLVVYEPDYSRVREIEISDDGVVYVLSAQAIGANDWLLLYDADDPSPRPEPILAPLATVESPAALLLASDRRLYMTRSRRGAPGRTTNVYRYNVHRSGPVITGISLDAAFDSAIENNPEYSLPSGVTEQTCSITSLVETYDHRIVALGFCAPLYPAAWTFNSGPPLFTKPTLATYTPATNTWVPAANFLSAHTLAYPLAATVVTCGMDLDDDGLIGLTDLAILLANFGRTDPGVRPQLGDVNNSGTIDLTDLAVMLTSFGGPCP